jgi:hypothetical protein
MKIYWNTAPCLMLDDGDFYDFFKSQNVPNIEVEVVDNWIKYLIDNNLDFVTLNPMIPNFMDDDFAKENVYIKTKNGFKKLGEVSQVLFKFKCLGPGEVVCDTDFSTLE